MCARRFEGCASEGLKGVNQRVSPSPALKWTHLSRLDHDSVRTLQNREYDGIQTPMAQGQSNTIISMIEWIRTSRLSIKNSLSWELKNLKDPKEHFLQSGAEGHGAHTEGLGFRVWNLWFGTLGVGFNFGCNFGCRVEL